MPDDRDDDTEPDLFSRLYVSGSDTSENAADEIVALASELRRRVYAELLKYPLGLTDHQLQDFLAMNPSTERPRRVELVRAGLVRDSGLRRLTPSGRKAVVWVARTPRPLTDMLVAA